MDFGDVDRSWIDALSWRLASELVRRHPDLVLNQEHPGDGMYDCLTVRLLTGAGTISFNRNGSIHILQRFDARTTDWEPLSWETYLRADPRRFLKALEESAGLAAPPQVPPSTTATLLYRIIAHLTASAVKTPYPYDIQQGFIDSSGYDAGPNSAIDAFPRAARALSQDVAARRENDSYPAGLDYWIIARKQQPMWAIDRVTGSVWTPKSRAGQTLMELYRRNGRRLEATVACLAELLTA